MDAVEIAQIVGAAILAVAVLVAIWQVFVTQSNERKRSQPVAIAHEDRSRTFDSLAGGWKVLAHITNEGPGIAYNVRWGVSYYGVRYAYRLHPDDPYSGNRHRVLHPRESVPADGSPANIVISSVELLGGKGTPEDDAFYWARYENAQGRTWETRNPPDRSANLRIKRVYLARFREWRFGRRRRQFEERGRRRDEEIAALILEEPNRPTREEE